MSVDKYGYRTDLPCRRCGHAQRFCGSRCADCYRSEQRESTKWSKIKQKYGLTRQEYEEMSARQDGLCAICNQPETAKTRNGTPFQLAVDHDHETGEVRLLLCSKCNTALGLLDEDPKRVLAMLHYLEAVLR